MNCAKWPIEGRIVASATIAQKLERCFEFGGLYILSSTKTAEFITRRGHHNLIKLDEIARLTADIERIAQIAR